MSKQPVKISDHALLRYIERVHGFDVGNIRDRMSKGIKKEFLGFAGSNEISLRTAECRYVIKGGVVITVTTD